MSWHPNFKLYTSDGISLIYFIENVITTNYPQDNPAFVQLTNLRSAKGIIIPGGNKPWELTIRGILTGTDYTDLQAKITALKSAIEANVPYILKIDTSPTETDDLNVIRENTIFFDDGRRTKFQYFNINFSVNSW